MSSPTPLVGVTTYPPTPAGRFELPEAYVTCLRRAGADVVLLPPPPFEAVACDELDVGRLLGRLDGLVLAGGGDVDPDLYGGSAHETVYALHPGRDRSELAMVDHVLATGLPTFAICRGSQVLNVALGGTLVTHLPDALAGDHRAVMHRLEPEVLRGMPEPTPHEVTVEPGSLVADVMGATTVRPMSWHHQSVDRPGAGLRVVARAPDGTVEATEHESHPWLCSVQWHPELTAADDPTQQRLFDRFVDACGGAPHHRSPGGDP